MKPKSILKRLFRRFFGVVLTVVLLLFGLDYGIRELGQNLYPKDYGEFVENYSAAYGVDPDFAYSLIKCESNFKPEAVSKAGAKGLMQMTPDTFSWVCQKIYGHEVDEELLFDPETNIKCGIWYISYLQTEFATEREVIAAYNAGPAHVKEWLSDSRYSTDGKTLSALPYKETENHIKKVQRAKTIYKKLYESR